MRGEGAGAVRGGWGFNGSRLFESAFFQFCSSEFLEGRLELFFYVFRLVFGSPGGSFFVSVSQKHSFLRKSADPRFLYTV